MSILAAGRRRTADWLLAGAFIAITQAEIWVFEADADLSYGVRAALAALALVASGALAFRQTHAWQAFAANGLAVYGLIALGFPSDFYQWTNLIATYSVAAHASSRQSWIALPFSIGGVLFYFARFSAEGNLVAVAFSAAMWLVGWLAGRMYGARAVELRLRAERDLSLQMAAMQEERLEVEDERARIARELHDIIGHSVNVMVIHAGAGRGAVPYDADAVRQAFETIESTGRAALDELDRVLAILRRDESAPTLGPLPGIQDLPALAHTLGASGLAVELSIEGDVKAVPSSVALSAYRIVQEALTNTLKHASAQRAEVAIDAGDDSLTVTVNDDGVGLGADHRPGRGTRGMRERAALHGGTLDISDADTGVVVRATLSWDDQR